MDRFCEKFPHQSPYVAAGNNPVNFVDVMGDSISPESRKEWDSQKKYVTKERDRLQKSIDKTNANDKLTAEQKTKRIGNRQDRVNSLNKTLSTMGTAETSSQVYALKQISGNVGNLSFDANTNVITINYTGTTSNFVHEVTHVGQFENKEVGFYGNGTVGQDIDDEVAAYQAQFAYSPYSVANLNPNLSAYSFDDITRDWVYGVKDPQRGFIYANGRANTGTVPVNMSSTVGTFIKAYGNASFFMDFPKNMQLKDIPGVYYKK